MEIMTLDKLIAACTEARKKFERAEVDYFVFLQSVESDHKSIWKAGCGTFESFLEQYVGLPRPSRYAEFRSAVKASGIEIVRELGIDAATVALKASSKQAQASFQEGVRAWVQIHNGVHPSRETVKDLLRRVDPRPEAPRSVGLMRELEELRVECDRLKRENNKLEREKKQLEAEIVRLKGKATSKGVSQRKMPLLD